MRKIWLIVLITLMVGLCLICFQKQICCAELKREQFTEEEWERMKKIGIVPDEEKEVRERRAREAAARSRRRALEVKNYFRIIEPEWDFYSELYSGVYQPCISFRVQNIGSSEIKELWFKGVFFYKRDTMMGQKTMYIENLPPGCKTLRRSIICSVHCPEVKPGLDWKRTTNLVWAKIKVQLYWRKNHDSPWKELPNFSKFCKMRW